MPAPGEPTGVDMCLIDDTYPELFFEGVLCGNVVYLPHFLDLVRRRVSGRIVDYVQDQVERVVSASVERRFGPVTGTTWKTDMTRSYAHHLFVHTGTSVAATVGVLGYLDRMREDFYFEGREFSCERLLLGLFMLVYKYILRHPIPSTAWATAGALFDDVEDVEQTAVRALNGRVHLSQEDMLGHREAILALYPDSNAESEDDRQSDLYTEVPSQSSPRLSSDVLMPIPEDPSASSASPDDQTLSVDTSSSEDGHLMDIFGESDDDDDDDLVLLYPDLDDEPQSESSHSGAIASTKALSPEDIAMAMDDSADFVSSAFPVIMGYGYEYPRRSLRVACKLSQVGELS